MAIGRAGAASGHAAKVKIGPDMAAPEFYKEGKYDPDRRPWRGC